MTKKSAFLVSIFAKFNIQILYSVLEYINAEYNHSGFISAYLSSALVDK
jgi:hypothetical protein